MLPPFLSRIARTTAQSICRGIACILILLIVGIRPLLGPATCKFPIGCTPFALESLQTLPLMKALKAIFSRLLQCRP